MTNRETKRAIMLRQWAGLVQECQCSGMSVKAWCEINNIKTKTYYYRQAQVRKAACEHLSLQQSQSIATFAELNPMQGIVPQSKLVLTDASPCVSVKIGSAEVSISSGTDERTLAMILKVVSEL